MRSPPPWLFPRSSCPLLQVPEPFLILHVYFGHPPASPLDRCEPVATELVNEEDRLWFREACMRLLASPSHPNKSDARDRLPGLPTLLSAVEHWVFWPADTKCSNDRISNALYFGRPCSSSLQNWFVSSQDTQNGNGTYA